MAARTIRIPKRQRMAEEWNPLYEVAEQIKELAPWQWMTEKDMFGVQDPETGQIGFVSVMGMLGEHFAIGAYLGVDALHQFWELEDIADSPNPDDLRYRLILIPQMQASFEDREFVQKEELGIMRRLGLSYHGHSVYPVFRNLQPGCPLWLLNSEQIPFLKQILEQTLNVAPRYQQDDSLLYPDNVGDDEMYLLRVPTKLDGEVVWTDEIRPIPKPTIAHKIPIIIDTARYEALQNMPRVGNSVEIDLFMFHNRIVEPKGKQPYFPFILMIVECDSGVVLAHKLLSPLPSLDKMYGKIPQIVIDLLLDNKILPYEILTQTHEVTVVLSTAFNKSETPIIQQNSLPMMNEAKTSMLESGF